MSRTNSFHDFKVFDGYRLLAVDGSDLGVSHNPSDSDTYLHPHSEKGFNLLHLNAMYDLCNKLYVDAVIQPGRKVNEYRALTEMVDRSSIQGKVLILADRGYESYNVFAHAEQKGWNYMVRVKDINRRGILCSKQLPTSGEIDKTLSILLTRKKTKEIKAAPEHYQFISNKSTFDYLDANQNDFYPMTFRAVRFKISEDTYETIITNLDPSDFPAEKIKYLYHLRWGIETSFRELKYAIRF